DCRVYESAQVLRPLGVGINLLPHAVNELEQLGLLDPLSERAIATSSLHYYNKLGQPIWREPRGLQAGYPLPQFSIHRGEFQMLLADTVRARLGPDAIVTGMALESADQDGGQARAHLRRCADGALHIVTGDAVVGADGIHSALRRQLHPSGDEPRFSGRMLWRGAGGALRVGPGGAVVAAGGLHAALGGQLHPGGAEPRFSGGMLWRAVPEAPPYLDGCTMFMAGHQDQKFVCYPISEPLRQA